MKRSAFILCEPPTPRSVMTEDLLNNYIKLLIWLHLAVNCGKLHEKYRKMEFTVQSNGYDGLCW